eukprot:CAMPEP_0184691694 /NCGR_PEP_ID=MMETSP0313-20130426/461_1 /TAXON_ID=2792 /ORGANISM="Porphyridium aerugineum, Strain SAG 1380-2" /LENGTH=429 /DNA_ID=CAMNT_0027149451 /DNA_START=236 /DNA_END=1525 /DNA_ORIENTATION=+
MGKPKASSTKSNLILPMDRDSFPILNQLVHDDKQLVYLDSAATSQKPIYVLDKIMEYYNTENSNVHRGAHALSAKATESFERSRDLLKALINSPRREQVIFTRNATEAINLVSNAWGRKFLKEGDVVISSVMEHHSNLVPWQMVTAKTGALLKHVMLDEDEKYDMNGLRDLLEKHQGKVKLVVCNHVSNMLGCVNPVKEITKLAHEYGAKVLIDGCQSTPHMKVDMQDIDCDFFAASGHKMCAPTGIGFLYAKKDILLEMDPFLGGGEMIDAVYLDHSTWAMLPHKFEAGTPAIAEVIGLGAAIEYLNRLDMDKIHDFEQKLGRYLYDELSQFKEVKIYGPHPDKAERASLCAFNVNGVHPSDLSTMIDLEGVALRSGHHCTQPLHRHFNIDASARASLYIYNSSAEIDVFIHALKDAVSLLDGKLTLK